MCQLALCINPFPNVHVHAFVFTCLHYKSVENTMEKGEIAH